MSYAGLASFVAEVTATIRGQAGGDPSDVGKDQPTPNEVVEVTANAEFEAECVSKVSRNTCG